MDNLEAFRREWIQELNPANKPLEKSSGKSLEKPLEKSGKSPGKEVDSALELYIQGSRQESNGKAFDAMMLYRKAIKLDPNVEAKFRLQIQNPSGSSGRSRGVSEEMYPGLIDRTLSTALATTSISHQTSDIWLSEGDLEWGPDCVFNRVPIEVTERILAWSLYLDISHLSTLSASCKRMALVLQSPSIYKFLSLKYHDQDLDDAIRIYQNNWIALFMEKPRLRQDGVYVSKVDYLRTGYSDTFLQPTQMVTYYRYIRILPNNACLVLTTPSEPIAIVKELTSQCKLPGVMTGMWVPLDHPRNGYPTVSSRSIAWMTPKAIRSLLNTASKCLKPNLGGKIDSIGSNTLRMIYEILKIVSIPFLLINSDLLHFVVSEALGHLLDVS